MKYEYGTSAECYRQGNTRSTSSVSATADWPGIGSSRQHGNLLKLDNVIEKISVRNS